MLKLPPLQCELPHSSTTSSRSLHAVAPSTATATVTAAACSPSSAPAPAWASISSWQVSEVEILLCHRGFHRHGGGGAARVTVGGCLGGKEPQPPPVGAKANWGKNHHTWRLKRSCSWRRYTILLSQRIRGTARDVGSSGLLLEPLSYVGATATPAVERSNSALSPAGVDDEERFLNALVASARIRESSRRNDCTGQDAQADELGDESAAAAEAQEGAVEDEELKEGKRGSSRRRHLERLETKKLNNGKQQAWRLYVEGLRSTDEQHGPSLEANSDHLRGLEETILFLDSMGVDATKVLGVYPFIVNCSLEKSKSIIDTLQAVGLKGADLGRILTMSPQIFGLGVEKDLRPKIEFLLKEVGLNRQDLRKVIRRCPRLLVVGIDDQLRPTMQFLRNIGFTHMASVVSNNATLLTCSVPNKLSPKLRFLQSLGMSFEDAATMAVRFPAIFNYGVEQNLRPKYEYLVTVMERDLDDLKAFPQYFGYSLDYRIRPRHELLAARNIRVSLPTLLKISDEQFALRFQEDVRVKAGKKPKLATVADSQAVARRSVPVPSCL